MKLLPVLVWFFAYSTLTAGAVELPQGFTRFQGTDPSLSEGDLAPILEKLVGNARVVAIGESVHGTAEYTKLEHRMVRYLVERKGFRIFVLEDPRLRSEEMTQALANCAAPLPMKTLYFPADEDQNFFQWIKTYNCEHPTDPIHFRGVDIWDRYWDLHSHIIEYARKLGIEKVDELDTRLRSTCVGNALQNWDQENGMEAMVQMLGHIPNELYQPCTRALETLMGTANTALKNAIDASKRAVWAEFLQIINTALARQENLNQYYFDFGRDWNARDKGQARNVYYTWQEFGNDKKIVWISHTSHTSHMRSGSDWWKSGTGRFKSAVFFFEKFYAQPVVNMMLTSYHTTGAQGDWATPDSGDSLDLYLHNLGEKFVAIDPKSPFLKSKPRWWLQNENSPKPDGLKNGVFMVPEDNFDYFFFIDETLKGKKIEPWVSPWEW